MSTGSAARAWQQFKLRNAYESSACRVRVVGEDVAECRVVVADLISSLVVAEGGVLLQESGQQALDLHHVVDSVATAHTVAHEQAYTLRSRQEFKLCAAYAVSASMARVRSMHTTAPPPSV
eukprot:scaffold30904_cov88-Phaeocystis_antarctica.AAC.3